jgi:hypothetical protein
MKDDQQRFPSIPATFDSCHLPEGGNKKSRNKSATRMSWKMPPLQEIVLLYDKHEYAKKGKKMQTIGCGGAGCGA